MAAVLGERGQLFNIFVNIYRAWMLLLWIVPFCFGATHWIVTENGRIEQQANSFFNLQKPFDLVEFLRQEQRLDKMNLLQKDLDQEKKILQQLNQQEQADLANTFFETDSSCKKLKRRLHDIDVNLNRVISFNSKGINIADHIHVDLGLPSTNDELKTPICGNNLPFSLLTFDHLDGISNRHRLSNTSEPGLLSTMPHVTNINDWGHRVANALQKNSSSWVLQNMAALFWRVKGNTGEAVNCLRKVLYNSPREHRDMGLVSLALVLHHANFSMDSIILLHASLETTLHLPLHHFVLGTIYASLGMFDMSELCFQYVVEVQPDFTPAVEILESVVCEKKSIQALKNVQRQLKKSVKKLKVFHQRHGSVLRLINQHKRNLPLEQFTKQFHYFRMNCAERSFYPMVTIQDHIPITQLNDNEVTNLHYKIVSTTDKKTISTLNIQVDHGAELAEKEKKFVLNYKEHSHTGILKSAGKNVDKNGKKGRQEIKGRKSSLKKKTTFDGKSQDKVEEKTAENTSSKLKKQDYLDKNQINLSLEEKTKNSLAHAHETLARAKKMLKKSVMSLESLYPTRDNKKTCFNRQERSLTRGSTKFKNNKLDISNTAQFDESKLSSIRRVHLDCNSPLQKGCKEDHLIRECVGNVSNKKKTTYPKAYDSPSSGSPSDHSGGLFYDKSNDSKLETFDQPQTRTIKPGIINESKMKCMHTTKTSPNQDNKILKENTGKAKEKTCSKIKGTGFSSGKGMHSSPVFNPDECRDTDNMDALTKYDKFSVVANFEYKGINVQQHVNFKEDISGFPKPPRCLAKMQPGHQSFDHLKGIKTVHKKSLPPEDGIKQTFLMHAMDLQATVEEVGTRIHRALKKNSTSWVLLNLASMYWRITGDTSEAVRCLRLALIHSPTKRQDVSLINLASILFRAGFLEDAATVSRAVLKIYPHATIAHFTLANSLVSLGKITEATQHFLMVLQIKPGFIPAIERLKIIQCILWRHQKELEHEAEQLRLLLTSP